MFAEWRGPDREIPEPNTFEQYETRLTGKDRFFVLHLKKQSFPTPAAAVSLLMDAAKGTAALDPGDTGEGAFPRAVFFRYGNHIIGGGVLLDHEIDLDDNLHPVGHTLRFDPDTVTLCFHPMTYARFREIWKRSRAYGDTSCSFLAEFCCDARTFLAHEETELSPFLTIPPCSLKPDSAIRMISYIHSMADAVHLHGLRADMHRLVRLSGAIRVQENGLSEEELREFSKADLGPDAKPEDYLGGKAIVLGEFDPATGEITLYVHAILLNCVLEPWGECTLRERYEARFFSVLAHELFHAYHFDACGGAHWEALAPGQHESLHEKCRRLRRLAVAESLATAFQYLCCLYRGLRTEQNAYYPGEGPFLQAAAKLYRAHGRLPVPGWPYGGLSLLLRPFWRGRWMERFDRYDPNAYFDEYDEWTGEDEHLPGRLTELFRRPNTLGLHAVFRESLRDWDEAYRLMTERVQIIEAPDKGAELCETIWKER